MIRQQYNTQPATEVTAHFIEGLTPEILMDVLTEERRNGMRELAEHVSILHTPASMSHKCQECRRKWPCVTYRRLLGDFSASF